MSYETDKQEYFEKVGARSLPFVLRKLADQQDRRDPEFGRDWEVLRYIADYIEDQQTQITGKIDLKLDEMLEKMTNGEELKDFVTCEGVVQFARIHSKAVMPHFAHKGDSGFDLYTLDTVILGAGERRILPTGLKVCLPEGFEIQIRPRSGISAKTPLTVLLGTVDSGYRGEIGVIVHNTSKGEYVIKEGERIAQGVVMRVPHVVFMEIAEKDLPPSSRGTNGFGSTGK